MIPNIRYLIPGWTSVNTPTSFSSAIDLFWAEKLKKGSRGQAKVHLLLVSESNSEPKQVSTEKEKLGMHMLFTRTSLSSFNYF